MNDHFSLHDKLSLRATVRASVGTFCEFYGIRRGAVDDRAAFLSDVDRALEAVFPYMKEGSQAFSIIRPVVWRVVNPWAEGRGLSPGETQAKMVAIRGALVKGDRLSYEPFATTGEAHRYTNQSANGCVYLHRANAGRVKLFSFTQAGELISATR